MCEHEVFAVPMHGRSIELVSLGGLDKQLEKNYRCFREGGVVYEFSHLMPRGVSGNVPLVLIKQDELTYDPTIIDKWIFRKTPAGKWGALEGYIFNSIPIEDISTINSSEELIQFVGKYAGDDAEEISSFGEMSYWMEVLRDYRPGVSDVVVKDEIL